MYACFEFVFLQDVRVKIVRTCGHKYFKNICISNTNNAELQFLTIHT